MQVFQGILTTLFYLYYVKWKVIISFCSEYTTNNMEKKNKQSRNKNDRRCEREKKWPTTKMFSLFLYLMESEKLALYDLDDCHISVS